MNNEFGIVPVRGGFNDFAVSQLAGRFLVEFGWWADGQGAGIRIEVPGSSCEEILEELTSLPFPQLGQTLDDFGVGRAIANHDHDRLVLPDIAPDELVLNDIDISDEGVALAFVACDDDPDAGGAVVITQLAEPDRFFLLGSN